MTERLVLGSVTLEHGRFAWVRSGLWVLWGSGDSRGSDKIIPGVPGARALPRRAAPTQYTIPIGIEGHLTSTNSASGLDPTDQAARNLAYLSSTLVTGGLVGVQVTIGTATRSGSAHVEGISATDGGPGWVLADMTLTFPSGRLS